MKQKHMFSLLDQTFTTVHVQIHGDTAPVPKKRYRDEDLSYQANMERLRPPPHAVDPDLYL